MAGVCAGTQEADLSGEPGSGPAGELGAEAREPDESGPAGEPDAEVLEFDEFSAEVPGLAEPRPEDLPPEAPRWFRSNAAGMALEEISSRFAALRYEYALVIDFFSPEELPELLIPYYEAPYRIEVHILYKNGGESRRQDLPGCRGGGPAGRGF
ncbi:MAG: hypothetical protein LBG10_02110 [Treponema sp.]|nr:hypothetical protein [Treponema sp.]